jgi:Flp pilus assembly protein TadG
VRRTPRHQTTRAAGQRGQSVVEFALVFPIFVLLVFGLIDAGRLIYLNSTLSQSAREAARLASTEASWIGSTDSSCDQPAGPVCPATVTALHADVATAANRMMMPFGSVASGDVYISCVGRLATPPTGAWTSQTCASNIPGSFVSVRIVSTYTAMTPIIGQILGSISLGGSATMVVN